MKLQYTPQAPDTKKTQTPTYPSAFFADIISKNDSFISARGPSGQVVRMEGG